MFQTTNQLGSLTNKRFRLDQHNMFFQQTYLKMCHQRLFFCQQNQGDKSNLHPHRDWRDRVEEKSTGKPLFVHDSVWRGLE